jgi:hypothetical protein
VKAVYNPRTFSKQVPIMDKPRNQNWRTRITLTVTLLLAMALQVGVAADREVISENLIHLQDDGKSYLLHRTHAY